MKDEDKTKEQLINELENLRQRIAELEKVETERKKVEKVLKEPEACYNTIFENTGTAMVIIEEDEKISLVNTEFEKLSGYSKDEIEGKKILTEFVVKDDLKKTKEYRPLRRVNSKAASRNYEVRFIDRKGNVRDIFMTVAIIPGTKKSLASLLDITEQKRAENQIKTSFLEIMEDLKEKEVLLREIHHRVKNNMQIISSLLNLQSEYIEDKKALELFRETQSRIKSMARVHEKLHQSEDLARIDFAEYIRSLTADLLYTYATEPNLIKLKIDVEDVLLSIDAAIPCGLLINELVSNSLKHAFPDKRKGELCIALRPVDDKLILRISDNGVGFPEGLDFKNTETLGLQLVNALVGQLNGTIELDRTRGTEFKITFKELEYKKRI